MNCVTCSPRQCGLQVTPLESGLPGDLRNQLSPQHWPGRQRMLQRELNEHSITSLNISPGDDSGP